MCIKYIQYSGKLQKIDVRLRLSPQKVRSDDRTFFCVPYPGISNYTPFKYSFKVTDVFILSLSPLTLIRIPPFFICMKVPMIAYRPYLLWPLFLPNLPNDTFILGSAVHICSYRFFKRCLDHARYGMCNLISHYLILSPGRCSVQSCSLNPRHRFSGEKWCIAAQFQLISHYTCRDTGFLTKKGVSLYKFN